MCVSKAAVCVSAALPMNILADLESRQRQSTFLCTHTGSLPSDLIWPLWSSSTLMPRHLMASGEGLKLDTRPLVYASELVSNGGVKAMLLARASSSNNGSESER